MVLFALSLDLILGYAGIVTLGPGGVLRARRLYGRAALGAARLWRADQRTVRRRRGRGGGRASLRPRVAALSRARAAGAHALDHHHAAGSSATCSRISPAATTAFRASPSWPLFGVFDYDLYGHTNYLYCARGAVRPVLRGAAHRLLAVRRDARRHPRERQSHACDRLAGALAAGHRLHHRGRDLRRRRRAVHPDQRRTSRSACSTSTAAPA